jgi:hypothetical protein
MADVEPVPEHGTAHGGERGAERGGRPGAADTVRLQITVWEQLL